MSVALLAYLEPLQPYLKQEGVSELCINNPGELWLEKAGRFTLHQAPELTGKHLRQLANLIA